LKKTEAVDQDNGDVAMKNMLKIKRWEAELKQYELAFLLGCSATYLSMVENNRVEATQEFKRKAAEIFGVPVDELFGVDFHNPQEIKKRQLEHNPHD
jgi:transcriptional regulator with XRE-family HTH domain